MDEERKDRLLEKETMMLEVGPEVYTILNRQLIPSLKWASDVSIYTKPIGENNLHEMVIIAHGIGWNSYSFHKFINVPNDI